MPLFRRAVFFECAGELLSLPLLLFLPLIQQLELLFHVFDADCQLLDGGLGPRPHRHRFDGFRAGLFEPPVRLGHPLGRGIQLGLFCGQDVVDLRLIAA